MQCLRTLVDDLDDIINTQQVVGPAISGQGPGALNVFGYNVIFAIFFTQFAHRLDNLIQAVNVLGSLVYGVILGIFVVAFFLKSVQAKAVFIAAIISEGIVLTCYFTDAVPFLWLNVIGCLPLMAMAYIFQQIIGEKKEV